MQTTSDMFAKLEHGQHKLPQKCNNFQLFFSLYLINEIKLLANTLFGTKLDIFSKIKNIVVYTSSK